MFQCIVKRGLGITTAEAAADMSGLMLLKMVMLGGWSLSVSHIKTFALKGGDGVLKSFLSEATLKGNDLTYV